MRRRLHVPIVAVVLLAAALIGRGQGPGAREIPFDATDPFKFPDNIHLGEVAGVASNSKGDVFIYTRTGHPVVSIGTSRAFSRGGSRLFQVAKAGKYVREIGQENYALPVPHQVRVNGHDYGCSDDQMSNPTGKVDLAGEIQMLLGRKAEAERVPALPLTPGAGGAAAGGGGRGGGGAAAAGAEGARRGGGGAGGGGSEEGGGRRGSGPPG